MDDGWGMFFIIMVIVGYCYTMQWLDKRRGKRRDWR